jgi:hypothetical protein
VTVAKTQKRCANSRIKLLLVCSFGTLQLPESVRAPSPVPSHGDLDPCCEDAADTEACISTGRMMWGLTGRCVCHRHRLAGCRALCVSQTPPCWLSIFLFVIVRTAGHSGRSPAEIVGSNPTGGMGGCCECFVFSGRGLCDELITCPGESYRLWCVVVCDLETS